MKKLFIIGVFVSLLSVLTVGAGYRAASAEEVDGTTYQRSSNVYDRTIYRADDRVAIYDLVNGDVYCFGERIIIDAVINGDILCVGNNIDIKGTISHDVRLIANTATISAEVSGNISVVARAVTLSPEANIVGDATIIAQDATLSGTIGRDATIRANHVNITGTVGRNVASYHASMTISPDARIGGALQYSSPQTVDVPGGTVAGNITKTATTAPSYLGNLATATVFLAALLYIAWFVSLILTALGVAFLFPKSLDDSVAYAKKQPWITALAGLIALIVTPLAIGLLTLSIVGIPLALIIGLLFSAAVLLSTPFVAHLLGTLVFAERSHPVRALMGAVLLLILFVIPVINVFAIIGSVVLGTGMVMRVATERYSTAAVSYKQSRSPKT